MIGIGAIGGVVGGFLAHAGSDELGSARRDSAAESRRGVVDLVFVARGAQLEAVRAAGLRVESPRGAFTVRPPVVGSVAEIAWRPGDVAILAVKTQDAAAVLAELALVAPDVPVLCLTNGLEAERLALRFASTVYAGCVMLPATYLEPGAVQAWATPSPGAIDLGMFPDAAPDATLAALGEALRTAGFACEVRDDIGRWKRGKLISNLANGLEAMCGVGTRASSLGDRARREARAVFAAAGLSCTTEAEHLARNTATSAQPIEGRTRGGGSTWQSLARGARALETDYLNGEIVLLGRLHGVPTPINAMLQRASADAAHRGAAPGSIAIADLEARAASVV